MDRTLDELEFHAWPPRRFGGQQLTETHPGVLAIHKRTGAAVLVMSERSQVRNQDLAVERMHLLLANLPWSES